MITLTFFLSKWGHSHTCDIFIKFYMKPGSTSLFSLMNNVNKGTSENTRRAWTAVRNCLFGEYLQEESLDCYTVNETPSGKVTNASFLARSHGPACFFFSKQLISWRGQSGGVETDGGVGEGGREGLNNRWWWMEMRFTVCLCKRWADAAVEGGRTTVQRAGWGGKSEGPLSPVSPGGPHVCAGTSPAESPTPSSQRPGSYCFSPFGCPARGPNTDR